MNNNWEEVHKCINSICDAEINEIEKYPILINKISRDPIGLISRIRLNLIEKLSAILDKD
jgi:hypothetical protein